MQLRWHPKAREDRLQHIAHIRQYNPQAALDNDLRIQEHAHKLLSPALQFKQGRVPGTFEHVVSKSYVLVYQVAGDVIHVLRVLHTRQAWPA